MGRSWGAGGRGRRGLKGRRAQVGLPRSLAINDDPIFDSSSLPYPAPSGAQDLSTMWKRWLALALVAVALVHGE
ncbi:hypothetical protein STEG23_021713, partial [Scotinomys teguina]